VKDHLEYAQDTRSIEFKVDRKTHELLIAASAAARREEAAWHELMVRSLFDPDDMSLAPLSPDARKLKARLDEQSKYCSECGRPWEDEKS